MSAPTGAAALPPPSLRLRTAPHLLVREGGHVLVGGSPLRLIRLRSAGRDVVLGWQAGGVVGDGEPRRRLARRLLDAGILVSDPPATAADDVVVVVPVRDRHEELRRCLAALTADDEVASVVIVDDGSADGDGVIAVAAAHGATVLRHERPRGPAAARNTGARAAGTAFVAFVDSDVVVEPGWLRRLRGHFDDPAVGAAAPRVAALDGGSGALAGFERRRSSLDMGPVAASVGVGRAVPYVPSTAIVVRRDAFSAGGFDEELHLGEDVDFCWRLNDRGWRIAYDPYVRVSHEHRTRALAFLRRRWQYASSIGPLAVRHPRSLPAVRLDPATAAVSGLLLLGRPRAAAAAVIVAGVRRRAALDGRCARPTQLAAELTARSCVNATRGLGRGVRRAWLPGLLALATAGPARRASRRALASAFVIAAIEQRPRTASEAALAVVDDVVAALATWAGCAESRTLAPLLPEIDR